MKSSPNSDADGSMNIDPYLQCRVFLKMASLYEVMLQFDASIACVKEFLVLMRLKKDYGSKERVSKSLAKYMPSKRITTMAIHHGRCISLLSENSLDRCKIHLLIIKAYETMKTLSPWLCIMPYR